MDELISLTRENLTRMPEAVRVPNYEGSALSPGIVHVGLGNFHRAHQAWYLHRLMDLGQAHDWAIIGAGVRPGDAAQRERLLAQDCLTTLIELDPSGSAVEIIGSMIGFVPVEPDNQALIRQMADPAIRIVSMTVTEGGYFTLAEGGFDSSHPDIQHDAAHPDTPRTVFGAMIAALRQRRDASSGPFTCLSCDNLQGNGRILRQTLVSLARLSDPDLAAWIDQTCSFPNSMVDCIVPATGEKERALVKRIGIADSAPVTHENFRQWVVEDDFCAGRPQWEDVGATLSESVHDYEAMKLRLLNGGHQLLANAGELLNVETIAGCALDPDIGAFFHTVAMEEIAPEVDPVPGMTPERYIDLILRRFSNTEIVDTTRRVAFDGAARHIGFLHPVLQERLQKGRDIDGLALAEALWARMCSGTRDNGETIAPNDPHWEALNSAALAAVSDPDAWTSQTKFYGELGENARFREAFARWFKALQANGTRATLRQFMSREAA